MPAINVRIEESLLYEIRVQAARERLTRREWINRALAQATRQAAEQKQPEEAHVDG
jgi:predicted DNA binding CopG/RHH family protein